MTQRLALHHILTTQLAKNWEQEEAAKTRLARMSGRNDKVRSSLRSAHVPARYHAMMPDSRKTYDHMVARIHQTMQSVRPKRKPVPTVPLPDTAIPAGSPAEAPPLKSTLVSKHYPKRSRSGRVKGGANISRTGYGPCSACRSNLKPLALIRAGLNLKAQRAKSGGEIKAVKGFALQKQMNEVIRQKNVLESMLVQHKRLRQDRMTIVLDMQRMRADLDRICNKLDTSLQSLNSTRTLCSADHPKNKQSAIQKKASHNTMASSAHRRSGGNRKPKNNPIPMNRQSTLANKARKGAVQKKSSPILAATSHHRSSSGMQKPKMSSNLINRKRVRSN